MRLYVQQGNTLVKNIDERQSIVCSTQLNNEVYVKLLDWAADDVAYSPSNGSAYVEFAGSGDISEYINDTWRFKVNGTSGKLRIQVIYQNIFLAI